MACPRASSALSSAPMWTSAVARAKKPSPERGDVPRWASAWARASVQRPVSNAVSAASQWFMVLPQEAQALGGQGMAGGEAQACLPHHPGVVHLLLVQRAVAE